MNSANTKGAEDLDLMCVGLHGRGKGGELVHEVAHWSRHRHGPSSNLQILPNFPHQIVTKKKRLLKKPAPDSGT
jgi:hypothetical protein